LKNFPSPTHPPSPLNILCYDFATSREITAHTELRNSGDWHTKNFQHFNLYDLFCASINVSLEGTPYKKGQCQKWLKLDVRYEFMKQGRGKDIHYHILNVHYEYAIFDSLTLGTRILCFTYPAYAVLKKKIQCTSILKYYKNITMKFIIFFS
jgi:hypothetical protein